MTSALRITPSAPDCDELWLCNQQFVATWRAAPSRCQKKKKKKKSNGKNNLTLLQRSEKTASSPNLLEQIWTQLISPGRGVLAWLCQPHA